MGSCLLQPICQRPQLSLFNPSRSGTFLTARPAPSRRRRGAPAPWTTRTSSALAKEHRRAGGPHSGSHLRAAGPHSGIRRTRGVERWLQRLPLVRPLAELAHRPGFGRRAGEGARGPGAGRAAAPERGHAAGGPLLFEGAGADAGGDPGERVRAARLRPVRDGGPCRAPGGWTGWPRPRTASAGTSAGISRLGSMTTGWW